MLNPYFSTSECLYKLWVDNTITFSKMALPEVLPIGPQNIPGD